MAKLTSIPCVLTEFCVYTIKHSADLIEALRAGRGEFSEQKPWVKAKQLLEDANSLGQRLPIIFAPAEFTRFLFAWALLDTVEIDQDSASTMYTFSNVRCFSPLKTTLKKQDGNPIAPGFIKPYALCITPPLLE